MSGFRRAPKTPPPGLDQFLAGAEASSAVADRSPSADTPAPAPRPVEPARASEPRAKKPSAPRTVRRNFSMLVPEDELINDVARRAAAHGVMRHRSDVIRAGVQLLADLTPDQLTAALQRVEKLK